MIARALLATAVRASFVQVCVRRLSPSSSRPRIASWATLAILRLGRQGEQAGALARATVGEQRAAARLAVDREHRLHDLVRIAGIARRSHEPRAPRHRRRQGRAVAHRLDIEVAQPRRLDDRRAPRRARRPRSGSRSAASGWRPGRGSSAAAFDCSAAAGGRTRARSNITIAGPSSGPAGTLAAGCRWPRSATAAASCGSVRASPVRRPARPRCRRRRPGRQPGRGRKGLDQGVTGHDGAGARRLARHHQRIDRRWWRSRIDIAAGRSAPSRSGSRPRPSPPASRPCAEQAWAGGLPSGAGGVSSLTITLNCRSRSARLRGRGRQRRHQPLGGGQATCRSRRRPACRRCWAVRKPVGKSSKLRLGQRPATPPASNSADSETG